MTSGHFKTWLQEVFFPNTGRRSLLLDSCNGPCSSIINERKPANKDVMLMTIPKGTTGRMQSLDVYGFRVWKNVVRRFSDNVLLHNYDVMLMLIFICETIS
ncbi:uncharacterized protein LOC105698718 [Orussus abietinus]|uniref:uncharacterized protein LOC105698718 n=1 Tax=Orussus abietinus TaxID=222816 RepID=UPI000624F8C5|nr:uncharacterized protein LOC105698718 [Orussus abietinus]